MKAQKLDFSAIINSKVTKFEPKAQKLDLKVQKLDLKVQKLDLKAQKLDLKAQKLDFSAFQLSAVGWICAQKKACHYFSYLII